MTAPPPFRLLSGGSCRTGTDTPVAPFLFLVTESPMPAVVLPPRFGYGPNAVKIVLLPPQKDGHRILIAIPTQPRRGRVRLTLAQYDRFLRNAVGFYRSEERRVGKECRS